MKIKKQYIFIGLIFLITSIIIIFSFLSLNGEDKDISLFESIIEVDNLPVPISKEESNTKISIEPNIEKKIITDNEKYISVILTVFDKSYPVKIQEKSSVYEAMKNIKDDTFSFNGIKHSGLGYFVNEINGVKGESGKYWFYYVNGEEASIGISNYILKDGDIISWKQK